MDYMTMLDRVAYGNAMAKWASKMQKKAEDAEKKTDDKKDDGEKKTTGQHVDDAINKGKEVAGQAWDQFKGWAGKNQQGLIGAGTAAVAAPAIHYGLSQIPWFKQRRLLNYLTSGILAGAGGVAAGAYGPALFAKKEETPEEKPAETPATV